MSLYLGKQKVQVPKVTSELKNKVPAAFFQNGGGFAKSTATSMEGWWDYEDTLGWNGTSGKGAFYECTNLTEIPALHTEAITNAQFFFYRNLKLTNVPALDMSNATSMDYMFGGCSALITAPELITINATSMEKMFADCYSLTSVPLFDTSKVTNMRYMFQGCSSLTSVPAFDTSKVTNMSSMFQNCSSLTAIHMTGMKVSFDISASTKFEESALVEILNNLATVTSTQTLTMGSTNLAKLTDDEKAIATGKGWTLK